MAKNTREETFEILQRELPNKKKEQHNNNLVAVQIQEEELRDITMSIC